MIALIAACGGDKPAADAVPADTPPSAEPTPAPVVANAAGEAIYAANCVACHQPNGQGMPGAFPPLAGSEWVTGSVDRPIAIVLHGLQGPITVAGTEYNGVMVAGGTAGAMDDQQIADVLSYVRSSWGNSASAVTVEDVARVRAAHASRTTAWTATELQALP
jgi:mono/diheme cytochrome c family protein